MTQATSFSRVARRLRPSAAILAMGAFLLPACAKIAPPSGGPPDLEPPRLVGSEPDSGAANVPLDVRPSLIFSEPMEPRSTMEAVAIAPVVEIKQRRVSSRGLTLVFEQPLDSAQTYTVFVSGTARDRHGNPYGGGALVVFSTAATFPPGSIAGEVEGRGFDEEGCYLWCYDANAGRTPDTTARDFDALGIANEEGKFEIVGLEVPGRYRLWAFADLNGNRSFEERTDVLAAIDTTFELSLEQPRAEGFTLTVVNPRAPGGVSGTVLDSLPDSTGVLTVTARSESDTAKVQSTEAGANGAFEFRLEPGRWRLQAFRDLNQNGRWDPARERASGRLEVAVEPASRTEALELRLRPDTGGP